MALKKDGKKEKQRDRTKKKMEVKKKEWMNEWERRERERERERDLEKVEWYNPLSANFALNLQHWKDVILLKYNKKLTPANF